MRKILYILPLLVLALVCQSFIFENNNRKAVHELKNDIQYIEHCLKHQPKDPSKLIKAINNVEKTTRLQSEAGGDIFGRRYYPTRNDIERWKDWLKTNKKELRWDKDKKKVYVPKKEKPARLYSI